MFAYGTSSLSLVLFCFFPQRDEIEVGAKDTTFGH